MAAGTFFIVTILFVLFGLQRRLTRLPLRPALLNLPVIFSFLFLLYYAQYYFLSEVIFGIPADNWLPLTNSEKRFASLFLISYLAVFWIGYLMYRRDGVMERSPMPINYAAVGVTFGVMTFGAFIVYVGATGGIESFVTNHREAVYQDQWARTAEAIAFTRMRMITSVIMMAAAIVGGYLAGSHVSAKPWHKWLYYSLPLPATLVKIALLSRGFFLLYAIFFLAKTVADQRRQRYVGMKMAALFMLVMAGVTGALLLRSGDEQSMNSAADLIYFTSRSVNGISGYFDSYAVSAYQTGGGLVRILLEISPMPSFLYSSPYENNLTVLVHGAATGSSAPMPFIGEAYYNLGWYGLTIAAFQGYFSAIVNTRVATVTGRNRLWWLLLYIATLYSFLYMPHSGLRSCTRLIVWVLLLFGIKKLLVRLSRKRYSIPYYLP